MRGSVFLLLCCLCVWSGCSETLQVAVTGEPEMNSGGNAAIVKIYQLGGASKFRSTPLSAFWRDDAAALGNELVVPPRTLTVYPAESKTIEVDLASKAQYVGVAANLREPDREEWRSLHALNDMGDEVAVTVGSRRVTVRVEDRTLPRVGLGLGR